MTAVHVYLVNIVFEIFCTKERSQQSTVTTGRNYRWMWFVAEVRNETSSKNAGTTEFNNRFTSAPGLANGIRQYIFGYRLAGKLNDFQHEKAEAIDVVTNR